MMKLVRLFRHFSVTADWDRFISAFAVIRVTTSLERSMKSHY